MKPYLQNFMVKEYKLSRQSKNIIIQKGELAPGVYNCVIEAEEQQVSKTFIRIN